MNALTPTPRPERIQVLDAIPILDTGRFEQMQRIASVMARTPLVPDCLRFHLKDDGKKGDLLPTEEAVANCFLVVNQSVRWGLDPFAVASCCSLVRGKLMFEGKLVAAVLAAKLNEQLVYEWNDKQGDAFGIRVTGSSDSAGNPRVIEGTVGQWKTNGAGSPWSKPADHRRQLAYRGTRDWTRLYEPAVLLGVYTPDEMDGLEEGARAARATPVSGPPRAVRQTAAAQIEHQPVQQVVPAAETKPAETVSATSQQAKAGAGHQARRRSDPAGHRECPRARSGRRLVRATGWRGHHAPGPRCRRGTDRDLPGQRPIRPRPAQPDLDRMGGRRRAHPGAGKGREGEAGSGRSKARPEARRRRHYARRLPARLRRPAAEHQPVPEARDQERPGALRAVGGRPCPGRPGPLGLIQAPPLSRRTRGIRPWPISSNRTPLQTLTGPP